MSKAVSRGMSTNTAAWAQQHAVSAIRQLRPYLLAAQEIEQRRADLPCEGEHEQGV